MDRFNGPPKKRRCVAETPGRNSQSIILCLSTSEGHNQPSILNLPPEVLETILMKVNNHAEIARLRLVCRYFRDTGQRILNKGFTKVQEVIQARLQVIKSQMPRRESSRRKHPLARECDIMETLRMRLVLMQMTFGKHIEEEHCCFFAGEILDEILHILQYTRTAAVLGRVCKVTDELFDLSTMAMEYFKERIEPGLPQVNYFSPDLSSSRSSPLSSTLSPVQEGSQDSPSLPALNEPLPDPGSPASSVHKIRKSRSKAFKSIRRNVKRVNANVTTLRREIRSSKVKLTYQNRQMVEYTARLEQYDRRFDEQSKKIETLVKELNQCRTEIGKLKSNLKPGEDT